MSFTWPWALTALLALPVVAGIAWLARRRRRRAAVRVTSVALVRAALPGRTRWQRRIPAALLALGIVVLGVGAARPQATVPLAANSTTIMLALDVSGSMCSTDVSPNRITAAENAAAGFIKAQPGGSRIGLVTFAGVAGEPVPPTDDTSKLLDGLKGLSTSQGTAIGAGILTSIDAISGVDPSVAPTGVNVAPSGGGYAADVIVVLTDGANTQGVDPVLAAQQAADRHLRVYTIGFGTTTPGPLVCDSTQAGTGGGFGGGGRFGGGGFGGGGFGGGGRGGVDPFIIDENALQKVAAITGGKYYRAENADQLQTALAQLPKTITLSDKHIDLAAWFAGGGGLIVAAALALSMWWNRVRRTG